MTVIEFKKQIGAKKYAEIVAYVRKLAREGKSPDRNARLVRARFARIVFPRSVLPGIITPCY